METVRKRSLFQKKIICTNCQKGMKFKRERSIGKYICSTYDTGKGCKRVIVKEDYLTDLLLRRFKSEELGNILERVKVVEVEDADELIIHFLEGDPIMVSYTGRVYKY